MTGSLLQEVSEILRLRSSCRAFPAPRPDTKHAERRNRQNHRPSSRLLSSDRPSDRTSAPPAYLTGWENVVHPVLVLAVLHVEARRNHSHLVDASDQVDDYLPAAMVVHDFELTNVAWDKGLRAKG